MGFKIGDHVMVMDENLSGIVKDINGLSITVETNDGFLLNFESHELIVQKPKSSISKHVFINTDVNSVIAEKELSKPKQQQRVKPKDRNQPAMEVDLHIHQLVNSSKHMSNFDMLTLQLNTAKNKLEYAISKRIPKVVFIHGVGEGVLKLELEYLFKRYSGVTFYDANYQKYGLGATEVYIYQNPTD